MNSLPNQVNKAANIQQVLIQYQFELPEDFSDYTAQQTAEAIASLIAERWPQRLAQFDYKGIEERDAYAGLITYLFEMAGDDINLTAIDSNFDEATLFETVSFAISDKQYQWRFSHQSKYLDKDLFIQIGQLMQSVDAGMFVEIFDEDCEQLAYVPRDLGQTLTDNPFITLLAI